MSDHGRPEHQGSGASYQMEAGMLDALKERVRCKNCRVAIDEGDPGTVHTTAGFTYCSAQCQTDDYQDWTK